MRKLAFVFLFLFAAAASAQCPPGGTCQAPVPPSCVVSNATGKQCAWVSLAALANRAGEPALSAAALTHPGPLRDASEVAACCKAAGVACEFNTTGLYYFLYKHVSNEHRPCAIGVYGGSHVVLCTHFEYGVRVGTVGNQPGGGDPRMWTWDEFVNTLRPDGMAFCLPGDDGKKKPAAVAPPVIPPTAPPAYRVAPVNVPPQARPIPADCPPGGT